MAKTKVNVPKPKPRKPNHKSKKATVVDESLVNLVVLLMFEEFDAHRKAFPLLLSTTARDHKAMCTRKS